jgi:REP element-mobilizing transposase RayT
MVFSAAALRNSNREGMSDPRGKISRIMKRPRQLAFTLRTHGGRRPGAGRKPKGKKALVSHAARPKFDRVTPAHVTLRIADDFPSLRSSRRFAMVRQCFADARGRFGMRLVEFSVLSNHLHLVVEADTNEALSRGMQGLSIRLATALNRALRRTGQVFSDHYHSRLLRSPTEVANVIRYVFENAARHYGDAGRDQFSSGTPGARAVLALSISWLVAAGRRRAGAVTEPRHLDQTLV